MLNTSFGAGCRGRPAVDRTVLVCGAAARRNSVAATADGCGTPCRRSATKPCCSFSRNRPELAPELLRDALHVELPPHSEARLESAALTDVAPAECRAELVVLLVESKPVLGIVVEVQLQRDERKRFTWPVCVAGLRARLSCPACVLIVTASNAVADWCREPIPLGPGGALVPLVVSPRAVPRITDVASATPDPELAVLSVMAHGLSPDAEALARIALQAMQGLDVDRQVLCSDLVLAAVGAATRVALEELMASGNYVL